MYRIFIIEDDPTIAQTLKKHLEGWDYKVECAKDFHCGVCRFRPSACTA